MADILAFWAAALVIAAIGFPFGAVLLRRLPDAGAGLALPLGLLFVSYIYFILRVFDILSAGRGGYLLAIVLTGLVATVVAGRDRWLYVTWRRAWPGIVVAFGVFTLAFFSYVTLRSYNAEIGGTEQPMDLMYLNATLTSEQYPPHDPWLAGEPASYYYFGYLQSGVLTAASGVPASVGYNLALAYTFAAAAAGIASLGFTLARWVLGSRRRTWAMAAGGTAVVLLLFVGSLAAVFEWTAAHGYLDRGVYEAFGAEEIDACSTPKVTDYCYAGNVQPRTSEWYPTEFWFWFRDTRIIPNTITEFPSFSFLLGDLHPHVMSIPLVLLVLGLAAATWRGRLSLTWRTHREAPVVGVALAITLGALAFQNAWDVATFTFVFALAALARNLRRSQPLPAFAATIGYLAPLAVVGVLLYLPWLLDFSSQAGGLKPYVGAGSRPQHVLLQWGPVLATSITTAAWAARRLPRATASNVFLATAWVPLLPFIAWLALASFDSSLSGAVNARGQDGWFTLALYAAALLTLSYAAVALATMRSAAAFPAGLAATGVLLLYGAELFVVKDIFFAGAPRLNTVFKLSYQAWILLALAGGVAIVSALAQVRKRPTAALAALPGVVLTIFGLAFPLIASFNRTAGFTLQTTTDGLAAVAASDPGEYDLVRWIDANVSRDSVVIEATGRRWASNNGQPMLADAGGVDYSDAGRISSRTGRATPIGWYFHEIQWRGDNPANAATFTRRQDAVDAVYVSGDPVRVLDIMRELGAEYLVVGRVEQARYAGLLPDFDAFLDVAHTAGTYVIYRVPQSITVRTS